MSDDGSGHEHLQQQGAHVDSSSHAFHQRQLDAEPTRKKLLDELTAHRIVFIGGLHRSGTTFLADALAQHPAFSGLTGTGAIKNEGQSLQTVFPWGGRWGGPGRFGFRRRLHLTEQTAGADEDGAIAIWRAWRPFWDLSKPNLVEKSPPNIVRSRFFAAAFPNSAFVFIVRHPIPVSLATRKWCRATHYQLVHHWARVHQLLLGDLPFLERAAIVRYEDMVEDFDGTWRALMDFLDAEPVPHPAPPAGRHNDRYFERWEHVGIVGRAEHRRIAARFGDDAARFGYSLDPVRPYLNAAPIGKDGGILFTAADLGL
ncbi:MAG: sulfotransferase [Acidimicrobiales bacterium]|nr:sulfotransferase [Acidimicrobiales bacterium]